MCRESYYSDFISHFPPPPTLSRFFLQVIEDLPFICVFRNITMMCEDMGLSLHILPKCPFQYETSVFFPFGEMIVYLWNILPFLVLFGIPVSRTWWFTFDTLMYLLFFFYMYFSTLTIIYPFAHSELGKEQSYLRVCLPFASVGWESRASSLFSVCCRSLHSCYALESLCGGLRHLKNGSNLSSTMYSLCDPIHLTFLTLGVLICKVEIILLTSMVLMRIKWN